MTRPGEKETSKGSYEYQNSWQHSYAVMKDPSQDDANGDADNGGRRKEAPRRQVRPQEGAMLYSGLLHVEGRCVPFTVTAWYFSAMPTHLSGLAFKENELLVRVLVILGVDIGKLVFTQATPANSPQGPLLSWNAGRWRKPRQESQSWAFRSRTEHRFSSSNDCPVLHV